jgi:dolichyl-diphosphooligosaccharide--protein glycosyltransferase
VFTIGDPYYHLRLALYASEHFPCFLSFDPYLNHPGGASVPWPPLYDLFVVATARLAGGGERALETAAALWPALLGSLTVLPVFAVGRAVGGPGLGLGAAALFAVLPASVVGSRVGYADHHAAVTLLGACLLALQLRVLGAEGAGGRRALAPVLALAALRAALVLTWPGNLAYLGIAETAFILTGAGLARRSALRVEAASLALTAVAIVPYVAATPPPLGGAFSAVAISWLHPLACLAAGVWAALAATWAARRASPTARLAWCAALGLACALALVPPLAGSLGRVAAFLGKQDVMGAVNPEQQGLYVREGDRSWALVLLGYFGFLVPLAPLLLLARLRSAADPAAVWVTAAWAATFGALAIGQARFAGDLAPSGAVAFAALSGWIAAPAARRLGPHGALRALPALALALVLLWPAVHFEHAPRLRRALAPPGPAPADRALLSEAGSLHRFARTVRAATPETAGFFDPRGRPEYAILADPSLGHVLHAVARRATPASNFGPYAGRESFETVLRVLLGSDLEAALATLEQLEARYVLTSWQPVYPPGSLLEVLHERDAAGSALAGRLRLVTEGPDGGRALAEMFVPRPRTAPPPYKLFERVEGAVLQVESRPGQRAVAAVSLTTPTGRRFVHTATGVADSSGVARIRVPYATEGGNDVRAVGPYRISAGGSTLRVEVSERAVRAGLAVRVSGQAG